MWSTYSNCDDDAFMGSAPGAGVEDDIFSVVARSIDTPVCNSVDSSTTNHAEISLKIDRKTLTLQPWSIWLQRFGGNVPMRDGDFIAKSEAEVNPATCSIAVDARETRNQTLGSTLNFSRAPLYGICPSQDLFHTVKCKQCHINVKPMAYRAHMKYRHNVALKSPDCAGASLWSSIISPQSITDEQEATLAVEQISEKSPDRIKKVDSPKITKSVSTSNLFDKFGVEPSPTSSTKSKLKKSKAGATQTEKTVIQSSKIKNLAQKKEFSKRNVEKRTGGSPNYIVSQKSEHRLKITISKKLLESEALNNGNMLDSKTGLPVNFTIPKIKKTKAECKQMPKTKEEPVKTELKMSDSQSTAVNDARKNLKKNRKTEVAAVISTTEDVQFATPCSSSNVDSSLSTQMLLRKDASETNPISVVDNNDKSLNARCWTKNLKSQSPAATCRFGARRYGLNSCPIYNRKYDFLRQMFELTLNCDFASNAFARASTSLIKRNRPLKRSSNKNGDEEGGNSFPDRSSIKPVTKPTLDEELPFASSSNEDSRMKSILKQKTALYPSANVFNNIISKDKDSMESPIAVQNTKIASNHNGLSRPCLNDGISVRLGRMENPASNHSISTNSLPNTTMNGISVHDPRLQNKQNTIQQLHQIPMLRSVKHEEQAPASTFSQNIFSNVSIVVSNAAINPQQTPKAATTTAVSTFASLNMNKSIKQEITRDANKAAFVMNNSTPADTFQTKVTSPSDIVFFGNVGGAKPMTSVQQTMPQNFRSNPLTYEYFNVAQSRKRASVPSLYTSNSSLSFGMTQKSAITVRAKRPRMGSLEYQTPQQSQRSTTNNFGAFAPEQKPLGTNLNRESLSIVKLNNNNAHQQRYSVAINAQNFNNNDSAPPILTPQQTMSNNVYGRQTIVNASGGVRAIATTTPAAAAQRVIKFSGCVGGVQQMSRPSSRTSASTTPPSSNRSSPLAFAAVGSGGSTIGGITASGTVAQQSSTNAEATTLLTLPLNAVILDGNRVYTVQNGPNGPKLVESAGNHREIPRGATFSIHTKKSHRVVPCHTSPRGAAFLLTDFAV
uniref:Uncharacterized protein n=1 Tax=Romanomermis culicivorax TaxID=13658 RepID=A0A915KGY0_ROMCU